MTIADRPATQARPDSRAGRVSQRQFQLEPSREPQLEAGQPRGNVSENERLVSLAAGSIVAMMGLARRDLTGVLIATVGGGLIYRGATGHCPVYASMDINTATEDAARGAGGRQGAYVAQSWAINRSPEELYSEWRKLENLPRIMTHLEEVRVIDDRRSHWVAKALPILGGIKVEWDAEVTRDEPNALIAWRSLPGSAVENTGTVQFTRLPGDRGTAVRAEIVYRPPAGPVGNRLAKMFTPVLAREMREDMRNFKRVMEVGEVPTVVGQPHGTCTGTAKRQES
jgi:uncharacterized membrane protein